MSAPEESTSATRQSTSKMRHDWRYIWEPGGEQFRKTRATLGRTAAESPFREGEIPAYVIGSNSLLPFHLVESGLSRSQVGLSSFAHTHTVGCTTPPWV